MITEGSSAATLAKMAGGSGVSLFGATLAWMDNAEQILRMGASFVAICSGLVVIAVGVRNFKNPKK